jgi:hypothetical protein
MCRSERERERVRCSGLWRSNSFPLYLLRHTLRRKKRREKEINLDMSLKKHIQNTTSRVTIVTTDQCCSCSLTVYICAMLGPLFIASEH